MKLQSIITSAFILFSAYASGQEVSKDSLKMLDQQKKNIEANKKINDQKIELAKLENQLAEKTQDAQKATVEAQAAANENKDLAEKLRQNPKDKKAADQAAKAARKAERVAKSANKSASTQEQLTKDIAELKEKIAKSESEIGIASVYSAGAVTSNSSASAAPMSSSQASTATVASAQSLPAQPSGVTANSGSGQIIQRNVNVDSLVASGASRENITEKVLEQTYKNYPQQPGQPSIIINNIIIPSDYQRPQNQAVATQNAPAPRSERIRDQDYEDYRAWRRERDMQNNAPAQTNEVYTASGERLTFRERFGEKPARNSGLWVIPVVGIHASDFKADLKDGEAKGRVGWNAGLDFRIHTKRFFVQPGVHYFSSSMRLTSEDSASSAPLLSGPRIQSLRVPLLLGLYLTKANKGFFKMNVKAGATGSYLLAVDNNDQDRFDKDNIEEFSYGLNAGIGLEFGLITLDISHEWGVSRLFKDSDMKNNILRATIGLKL